MPLDPVRCAEVRAWLERAEADLAAARVDLGASPPLAEDAVFHCQQAAEKGLKAFLVWHDRPFRKTHNLEELGQQCLEIDPGLRSEVDRAVPLTEYAWRYRYPGEPEPLDETEAADSLAIALALHEAVEARLPKQARP
jgi:HEPN domain-containing protein